MKKRQRMKLTPAGLHPVKAEKQVKDMTIGDTIKHPYFMPNLAKQMSVTKANANRAQLRIIASIQRAGNWNTTSIAAAYIKICDKCLLGYSANERNLIAGVGNNAFVATIAQLKKDEETRDNSNRID